MIKTTTEPAVVHSTFTLERRYQASPSRVFAAFADPEIKRRWFAENDGLEVREFTADFRVGGHERSQFRFKGGPGTPAGAPPAGTPMANETVYQDIVTDRRIVFAYTMSVAEHRISASLATVQIVPDGSGTKLTFTEQGAYFERADGPELRQKGWEKHLEHVEREMARS